jgi:hypothetical protein
MYQAQSSSPICPKCHKGRRPAKVVAVALANKMARIARAVLAKGESYPAPTRSSNAAIAVAA